MHAASVCASLSKLRAGDAGGDDGCTVVRAPLESGVEVLKGHSAALSHSERSALSTNRVVALTMPGYKTPPFGEPSATRATIDHGAIVCAAAAAAAADRTATTSRPEPLSAPLSATLPSPVEPTRPTPLSGTSLERPLERSGVGVRVGNNGPPAGLRLVCSRAVTRCKNVR